MKEAYEPSQKNARRGIFTWPCFKYCCGEMAWALGHHSVPKEEAKDGLRPSREKQRMINLLAKRDPTAATPLLSEVFDAIETFCHEQEKSKPPRSLKSGAVAAQPRISDVEGLLPVHRI
jgi:hypothetical protein